MDEQSPETVGAPSELATAQEMPGCVIHAVTAIYAVPYFLFRELPTLPLDLGVWIYDRFGRGVAFLYAVVVVGAFMVFGWWMIQTLLVIIWDMANWVGRLL